MADSSIADSLKEIRAQLEGQEVVELQAKSTQLQIQIDVLTGELAKERTYYAGINGLLDKLATVRGDTHRLRIALQILDLRNRKLSLKKVERGS
jgi:hypothetical protein